MKNTLTAPMFVKTSIQNTFSRLYSQIGEIDSKTGKPILNSKTVKKLGIMKPILSKIFSGEKISTVEQVAMLNCLHVSENMTAKLEDINAISTACSVNPVCMHRATCTESICSSCFAFLTFDRYDGLQQAAIINFIVLNAMVYSKAAWQAVSIPASKAFDLFRIEAFGDVASAVQCANYITLANTHKYINRIGVWSKNLGFWNTAFQSMGKPRNMVFNASSPVMNERVSIRPDFQWFIDHVFTVYTAQYAIDNNVNINCGDRKCKNCKRCYSKGNETDVSEILKQESKRYYKAIGKEFNGRI